jgi:hypothetical protein
MSPQFFRCGLLFLLVGFREISYAARATGFIVET